LRDISYIVTKIIEFMTSTWLKRGYQRIL
jgi:hypothetical protein